MRRPFEGQLGCVRSLVASWPRHLCGRRSCIRIWNSISDRSRLPAVAASLFWLLNSMESTYCMYALYITSNFLPLNFTYSQSFQKAPRAMSALLASNAHGTADKQTADEDDTFVSKPENRPCSYSELQARHAKVAPWMTQEMIDIVHNGLTGHQSREEWVRDKVKVINEAPGLGTQIGSTDGCIGLTWKLAIAARRSRWLIT